MHVKVLLNRAFLRCLDAKNDRNYLGGATVQGRINRLREPTAADLRAENVGKTLYEETKTGSFFDFFL